MEITRLLKVALLLLPILLLSPAFAESAEWVEQCNSLSWDPNQEQDLGGYRVYGKRTTEPTQYTFLKDVGLVTQVSCAEVGMDRYGNWHVALSAYDTSGNESEASAPVSLTIIPGFYVRSIQEPPTDPNVFVEVGGVLKIEAEWSHNRTQGNGEHEWVEGTTGAAVVFMRAEGESGTNNNTNYVVASPRMDYNVQIANAGGYYLWVRGRAQGSASDSLHVGVNGAAQEASDRLDGFDCPYGNWCWTNHTRDETVAFVEFAGPGNYTVNIWMRESLFEIDKILLTQDAEQTP